MSALTEVQAGLDELRASQPYKDVVKAHPHDFATTHVGKSEQHLVNAIAQLAPAHGLTAELPLLMNNQEPG